MLHQVGVSFDLYYDARKHKIKTCCKGLIALKYVGYPKGLNVLIKDLLLGGNVNFLGVVYKVIFGTLT